MNLNKNDYSSPLSFLRSMKPVANAEISAMAIKKCASFCAPALSGRNWTTTSSSAPAMTTAQMGPRDDFFFGICAKR